MCLGSNRQLKRFTQTINLSLKTVSIYQIITIVLLKVVKCICLCSLVFSPFVTVISSVTSTMKLLYWKICFLTCLTCHHLVHILFICIILNICCIIVVQEVDVIKKCQVKMKKVLDKAAVQLKYVHPLFFPVIYIHLYS